MSRARDLADLPQGDGDLTVDGAVTAEDITLSGGIYLGGTGSANKLDDYEEGTWTPAFIFDVGGSGTTYTTQSGRYVKVGNLVYVSFLIEGIGGVSVSDYYLRISGLPFNVIVDNQKIRVKIHNTGNTDFWLTTTGGTTGVFYASSNLNDFARGDDVAGRTISGSFTYEAQ